MIERAKEMFRSLLANKQMLLIFIVALAFIGATVYVYKSYIAPKLQATYAPNKEYVKGEEGPSKGADLYFFYTDWCPHCKKAKPEWQNLKDTIGDSKVNGYSINFIEVDCEKEKALADKFKVEGYPTIKLAKGDEVVEYDAKPSTDTLVQFLQSATSH